MAVLSGFKEITFIGQARNAIEAMEAIPRFKPDIAILDIQMPYGSGIDVLHSIRERKWPMTVIMYTGYPEAPYVKKCMDEGADFFFTKAKDFEKLMGVITAMAKHMEKGQEMPYDMPQNMAG